MKQFISKLLSVKAALIFMFIFSAAMGWATFVEDKYDTLTARNLIYNAKWFEFLMVILALSFIANITRYKMLKKGKAAGLIFHLAFVVILAGAALTRYIGFEGSMHIRTGQTSNIMYKDEVHLNILFEDENKTYNYDKAGIFNENSKLPDITFPTQKHGNINIKFKACIPNAAETITEHLPEGKDMIKIIALVNNQRQIIWITENETAQIGHIETGFNKINQNPKIINIINTEDGLKIKSPYGLHITKDINIAPDSIPADSLVSLNIGEIVNSRDAIFLAEKVYLKAKKTFVKSSESNNYADILLFDLNMRDKTKEIVVKGGYGFNAIYQDFKIGEDTIKFAYGFQPVKLPFSLKLKKFIIDRYAGTSMPSSYESQVVLIDKDAGIEEDRRIYMNHVLDYKGYRFFQSSYDSDEQGTILSVNHDAPGTFVTYLGYFLLAVGFFLVFFSKESRFYELRKKVKEVQLKRKQTLLTVLLLIGSTSILPAQTNKAVSAEHADKFGHLIVQTYSGRFAPVQTLALDIMHKISRKDKFKTDEKGELSAMQFFLDMQLNPSYWEKQKIIYIREQVVRDALGIKGKYASFYDFFDADGRYKLREFTEKAFRKKPIEQNKFDREILKVDERINIFIMTRRGSMNKLFPLQQSSNNEWVSAADSAAYLPLTGDITNINDALKLQYFSYGNFMKLYFSELLKSAKSDDYTKPDEFISYFKRLQHQNTNIDGFPSERQLDLEVFYNKANIFPFLRNLYGILSLLILIFAFYDSLSLKKHKAASLILNILIALVFLGFLYHTFGMALRWYLTGHAPWSNGYEALILVAWGGIIAGFAFLKGSKITLGASVLMAFFMLMTAGHSSYDPQLTNLQPVLKSYWLIIHVATLTISYSFLGAGFLLGYINMFLYILKNDKNKVRFDSVLKELSYINEMLLTIGLFLATTGTFLGGIWANESWGRYWGWDAKETWALVIVFVYTAILHFRLIPKLKNMFYINAGSILGFGTVLMTFIGVNYYLSKGLHSYASGETPIFPIWAWAVILGTFQLIIFAGIKEFRSEKSS